jgi:hypothetical protein
LKNMPLGNLLLGWEWVWYRLYICT